MFFTSLGLRHKRRCLNAIKYVRSLTHIRTFLRASKKAAKSWVTYEEQALEVLKKAMFQPDMHSYILAHVCKNL